MLENYTLSTLARAYIGTLLAAQDAEIAAASAVPRPILPTDHPSDSPISEGGVMHLAEADPFVPLTAQEIVSIAIERGLAELVHLTTMPASRSQKLPLAWAPSRGHREGCDRGLELLGTDVGPLDPGTGASNAFRAVRRHVPGVHKR